MSRRFSFAVPLMLALTTAALGQGKLKNKADKEPPSQTLPAQVELPTAVAAETARLTFHVAPLSSKGLLLQQTRDALKELMQANHGGRMVKLRAFVAGTGDARRVREIVSEVFSGKKLPLPVLVTVQAGDLLKDGAQVEMESVSEDAGKRPANPGGLAFFPARPAEDAKSAVEQLASAAGQAGVAAAADMLSVTCFLGSNEDAPAARAAAAQAFPAAVMNGAMDMVQLLRAGSGSSAACEGVGRRNAAAGEAVQLGPGAALVSAPKLIFTGAQMAFGEKEADLRLAFERLEKSMQPLGATYQDVVFAGFYPVSRAAEEKLAALSTEFFHNPAPATNLIFEGLPSPDASMSMEVIAAVNDRVRN